MKRTLLFFFLVVSLFGFSQSTSIVVSKTSPQPFSYDGFHTSITYFVQIGNNSAVDAEGLLVEIPYLATVDVAAVVWNSSNGTSGTGNISQTTAINSGEIITYQITFPIPIGYVAGTNLIDAVNVTHPTEEYDIQHLITNYSYGAGENLVYTITVANQGVNPALNVQVSDVIPTITDLVLTTVTWTGSNGTAGTGNLSDTIAQLNPDEVVTYQITIPIPEDYNQIIANTVNVTSDTTNTNILCLGCANYSYPRAVQEATIVATKTTPQINYQYFNNINQTITYFVQVGNNSDVDAEGMLVEIPYVAGVNAGSVVWSSTNGTSGTGAISQTTDINSGEIITYQITVPIPSSYLTGTSLIGAVMVTHPTETYDIQYVITDNAYVAGEDLVYTITVENQGPHTAYNVQVSDVIPTIPGIDPATVSWTGSNGSSGNGNLSDTLATLAMGQIVTYELTIPVPQNFNQIIANQVSVTSDTPNNNYVCLGCAHYAAPRMLIADVVATKSTPTPTFQYINNINQTITFFVQVGNDGLNAANDVSVNIDIPAIYPSATWTGSNGSSGTGDVTDTIPVLASGEIVTYQITVPIPVGFNQASHLLTNAAVTVTSPTPGSNLTSLVTYNTYVPGSTMVYVLTLTNTTETNPTTLPAPTTVNVGVTMPGVFPATDVVWNGTNGASGTGNLSSNVSILPQHTVNFYITVPINENFDPAVHIPTVNFGGPIPANITYTFNHSANTTGLVYTIVVENNGPDNAQNVQVTDIMPNIPGIDPTLIIWSGDNGTFGTGNLTDSIGVLANGQAVTYSVFIPIPSNYNQPITNSVQVTSDTQSPSIVCLTCNNYAVAQPKADLFIQKTNTISHYSIESDVVYTITVTNMGPSNASNIQVYDPYPLGIVQMNWSSSIGTSGVGQLNQQIPFLAVGQTVTYTVTMTVPSNFNTSFNLVNRVYVTSPIVDPNPQPQPIIHTDLPAPNYITVSTTRYTLNELVQDVLIDMDCALVSNITSQGWAQNTIGYFHSNNSFFPKHSLTNPDDRFNSGIIIKTGNANSAQGPFNSGTYNANNLGSDQTDIQLQGISNSFPTFGLPAGGTMRDVSYIQFDFTPINDYLSFNFLFASNEYGHSNYQCSFSDIFAFLLTDLTTGVTTNLAVVPGTAGMPISLYTIRDNSQNCPPVNANYYDGTSINGDPLNMTGNTKKLTAQSPVIPCRQYRIKLAIGDSNDRNFDAAVLIEAGSFDIGSINLGLPYVENLGTALCPDETVVLESGLQEIEQGCDVDYVYQWFKDDVAIPGAIDPTYEVAEAGVYRLDATINILSTTPPTQCDLPSGTIIVEYYDEIPAGEPEDMIRCGNIFDLTEAYEQIYAEGLDPNDATVTFHLDMDYVEWEWPIQWGTIGGDTSNIDLTAFQGYDGQIIYVRVQLLNGSPCFIVLEFTLNVSDCAITPPADIVVCDNDRTGSESFNLASFIPDIIGALPNHTVTFHYTFGGAGANLDVIDHTQPFIVSAGTTTTVYIRGTDNETGFYTIESFQITVHAAPNILNEVSDYELCDMNGSGQTIFDLTSKSEEILNEDDATLTFHTSLANAQSGNSPIVPADVYPSAGGVTIWVRAENANGCFSVTSFNLVLNPLGQVPSPEPLELCDNNNTGSVTFDLTPLIPLVSGNETDVVTFHQSLSQAQNNIGAIASVDEYTITSNQTVYIRISPQNGNCPSISSVSLVKLAAPQVATDITDYALCEEEDGKATFDLSTKESSVLTSGTAIITYHTTQQGAEQETNLIDTPTAHESTGGVIWVRAENANGCYSVTSFTLVVNALPEAHSPEPLYVCNDGTGFGSFDLAAIESTVSGGAVGVTVTFHTSIEDAESGDNELASPYNGTHEQILYIRVENDLECVTTTATVQLFLEESTIAPTLEPLEYCDPNSDGFGYFDLTQVAQIIEDANPNPVTISYHETIEDATFLASPIQVTNNYSNIDPYSQFIYIAITPNSGAACSTIATVQLIVHNLPQISDVTPLEMCDDNYDGFVRFDLTVKAEEVLNGLNPAAHTVRYYPTEDDARNNTLQIMNPTNYQNVLANTESIWIRVDDLSTGCFDVRELILIVNPLPVVDMPNVASYHLCDAGEDGYEVFDLQSRVELILDGQTGLAVSFYDTYEDALNAQNAYTNLMHQNNEQHIETVFVRVETEKGCFVITLMDLVVDPLPVLFPPTAPVVSCDSDGDGYGTVDLTQVIEEMLNGANPADFNITFHETYTDAEFNNLPIGDPQEYFNTHPFAQIIYVRVETTLGSECFNIYPITINVTAAPVIPIQMNGVLPALVTCDDNIDGLTHFDLTQQRDYILANQPNPANLSVSFYTSEQNALDRISAITNVTHYPNISNPQTIWAVLEDTVTGCFDMASFELEVNVPLVIPQIPSITVCDDDRDLEVFFDLTSRNGIILSNATNVQLYTVEFFYTYTDAINGNMANLITNPTSFSNMILGGGGVYTLGVRVTDTVTGCQSYSIMDIRRAPVPNVPTTPLEPLIACDDNGSDDLQEEFDITIYENYVRNGDTFVTISYHENLEDAEAGINAITDPAHYVTGTTTVYIRVANPANGGVVCAVLVPLDIIVNPLPVVADDSYAICETNSSGFAEFFFPDFNPELLGPDQALADFTISYHDTQADAISNSFPINQNNPYTNETPNSEVIWVRIVNNATGCIRIASITLYAEEGAVANQPSDPIFECDYDGVNDGFTATDLTQYEAEILQTQNPAQFIVSYYLSEADAHAGENAIVNPSNYTNLTQGGETIYIRVENSATIAPCYDVTSMQYIVEPLAEPHIESEINTICVDWGNNIANNEIILDSGVTAAGYTFQWYHDGNLISGATQSTYTVNTRGQEGEYYVIAVSDNGCVSEPSNTFEIHLSGTADVVEIITDNAFSDNQTITVIVQGYGEYLFQLDDGALQDTGYFVNVTRGEHTVTIYDVSSGDINTINSCSPLVIDNVQIIDYPRFFTPNGDGYNDYWNITGFTEYHKAEIHIFDRHGKLLKQLNPTGQGWDGTFNGNPLPSTDYWFKVIYTENSSRKEFKAHFSMKR